MRTINNTDFSREIKDILRYIAIEIMKIFNRNKLVELAKHIPNN